MNNFSFRGRKHIYLMIFANVKHNMFGLNLETENTLN